MTSTTGITQLLHRASVGDREALDAVFSAVYQELHRLARSHRRRWEGNQTLDTTSLIHEAYLKLVDQDQASWNDLPHFLAVAWILRDDYVRGGFKMLTVSDPDGVLTGRHIALGSLALVPVSLVPTLLGLTGPLYFFGALILGVAFVVLALDMGRRPRTHRARRLFIGSVLYLPALLAVMMVDKLPA